MLRSKPKSKKNVPSVHINSNLIYSERTIWSLRFKAWTRFEVHKPRLPNEEDKNIRWVEHADNCPKTFGGFNGKQNEQLFAALNTISDQFENVKSFPESITICGPPGSGKSAVAKVFTQKLIDDLNLNALQSPKWCLIIDAQKFDKDFNPLWSKINRFAEAPIERFIPVKFRLLVIDNFDAIPPSNQQLLKRIIEAMGSTRLKYVFVTSDPKGSMIGYILNKTTQLRTKAINDKDGLMVMLMMLSRHHIGYDRDGVKELFEQNPGRNLSAIFDQAQKVFVREHFLSRENIIKVSHKASELPVLTPTQSIEPMERCSICTLHPPCQHMTIEKMTLVGIARRKELPRYKTGSMSCPEFVRYGRCSIFNKHGHCSLDHPKNLHVIEAPMKRCPQCTIPWPCNHCAFSEDRRKLIVVIGEVNARIRRLKQINVPEPPMALTRHLESNPNWRNHLAKLESAYLTSDNTHSLKLTTEWLETKLSTNKDEYARRARQLADSYGELYRTDMLIDVLVRDAAAAVSANQENASVTSASIASSK